MDLGMLEKALEPYEKKLKAQERLRKSLGVKSVDRPTYERYITGPIERHHSQYNAFAALKPDNEFGEEWRKIYKNRTGVNNFAQPLPASELDPGERLGQALCTVTGRICTGYHPEPLEITAPDGRYDVTDKKAMSRLVKKVGMWLGADMVRITRVDQRWVYRDKTVDEEYAIVVVVAHDHAMNQTAPSHLSGAASMAAYSRLKSICTQLNDFIRVLGHEAIMRETLGPDPDMLMVPLAMDAGIGEFSRTGRCLSPEFGINMRMKPVTTNLPLAIDKPVSFNAHDYCMACESCATYCPAGAVPFGGVTEFPAGDPDEMFHNPGYRKWWIKADRCLKFWMANRRRWVTCGGRCIAVCPWNKKINLFHNTMRFLAIHSPHFVRKALVWADKITYHRKKSLMKTWNEWAAK
jgi:reductive dehalogenase